MSAVVQPIYREIDVSDLPQPKGKFMLVKMLGVDEKWSPGSVLHRPDNNKADEDVANPLAEVVLVGSGCFHELEPYCEVGDVIFMASYSGHRFEIGMAGEAKEYRLVPDSCVLATVPRPEIVSRRV